ncbi:MAG: hypothetical protein HQL37_11365 [Alphaproteobacteria bacterium]|nr:hypothetical protein [Alphaproteobacteria bacterium]
MAWKNFTKTLGSSAAEALAAASAKARTIIIQPKRANSHVIYIGGSGVTSADGLELNYPIGVSTPLDRQVLGGGPGTAELDLLAIYVIGTNGEGVQGIYEEF